MLVSRTEREIESMKQDAYDLARYVGDLRTQLDSQEPKREGGGRQKVVGSPAPWNEQVGSLMLDIHAAARSIADMLAFLLGEPAVPRGSTDEATKRALDRAAADAARLHKSDPENPFPEAAARRLATLAHRARQQLDSLRPGEEPWTRAPDVLRCPNPVGIGGSECGETLWLAPGWSEEAEPPAYCRSGRPSCTHADGSPYAWPYEVWRPVVTGEYDRAYAAVTGALPAWRDRSMTGAIG